MSAQESNVVRAEDNRTETLSKTEAVEATPLVDVFESQDEILLQADFPGVAREGLEVHLDGRELTLSGTQKSALTGYRPLAFSRSFRVPTTVDPNRVSAELAGGVLTLRLGKAEAAKPRRIEVSAS